MVSLTVVLWEHGRFSKSSFFGSHWRHFTTSWPFSFTNYWRQYHTRWTCQRHNNERSKSGVQKVHPYSLSKKKFRALERLGFMGTSSIMCDAGCSTSRCARRTDGQYGTSIYWSVCRNMGWCCSRISQLISSWRKNIVISKYLCSGLLHISSLSFHDCMLDNSSPSSLFSYCIRCYSDFDRDGWIWLVCLCLHRISWGKSAARKESSCGLPHLPLLLYLSLDGGYVFLNCCSCIYKHRYFCCYWSCHFVSVPRFSSLLWHAVWHENRNRRSWLFYVIYVVINNNVCMCNLPYFFGWTFFSTPFALRDPFAMQTGLSTGC